MITNCVVTLYNNYKDAMEKVYFKKTIIRSANWQSTEVTTIASNVLVSADAINIFIPFNADFEGKTYLEPKAWAKLSEIDKDKYFTFSKTDRIVKGISSYEWSLTNPITNLDKLDNVATIMSITVNDNGSNRMKHYQLGAK